MPFLAVFWAVSEVLLGPTFQGGRKCASHEPGMQSMQSCSHDLHLITHVPIYAAYAGKERSGKMIGWTVKSE